MWLKAKADEEAEPRLPNYEDCGFVVDSKDRGFAGEDNAPGLTDRKKKSLVSKGLSIAGAAICVLALPVVELRTLLKKEKHFDRKDDVWQDVQQTSNFSTQQSESNTNRESLPWFTSNKNVAFRGEFAVSNLPNPSKSHSRKMNLDLNLNLRSNLGT